MSAVVQLLERRIKRAARRQARQKQRLDHFPEYRLNPVGFLRDKLRIPYLTPTQVKIAESLLEPPYRTNVGSAHTVGKSFIAGALILWWHLTRKPSIVISTSPRYEQVCKVLWKEVRRLGGRLGPDVVKFQPKAPLIERGPDDFATGTTATNPTAFQGHHDAELFFVVDEGVAVAAEIMEAIEYMFQPPGHAWLNTYNRTDSGSYVYRAEQALGADGMPTWHNLTMSALDHPNILAELSGQKPPVPSAIRLGRLNDLMAELCEPVHPGTQVSTDVEWPPESKTYLRPGPLAEARLLGRWASSGCGVWSDALWQAAQRRIEKVSAAWPLVIGCDVARFGDDYTSIHVRYGPCSLHHERHNGWDAAHTCGRLKELCRTWAAWWNTSVRENVNVQLLSPQKVLVQIDQDGIGGSGVVDHAGDFHFVGVSAAETAIDREGYPNRRSELWFAAASRAKAGRLDLSRLDRDSKRHLQTQLLAPTYKLTAAGQREVEKKADTKQRLKLSPDDADALNLAYYEGGADTVQSVEPTPEPHQSWRQAAQASGRGGFFGRRAR
jgi:hypothetical protein